LSFLKKIKGAITFLLKIIASDLFANIPKQHFDIIAINPPYYKKNPGTEAEYAWYCGENSEYFTLLFSNLDGYINGSSEIYMILCDGCDIDQIKSIAGQSNYHLDLVREKRNIVETNYIFKIKKMVSQHV